MIATFDPLRYPGPRPSGPVLVHRGQVLPLDVDGPADAPFRLVEDGPGAATARVLANPRDVRFGVAYGSNASPGRLVGKGLDAEGALLLPARVADVAPAFEDRRTGYGSVPLTLVPSPGAVIDTWILGVPADATALLDRTEGRIPGAAPATVAPESGNGRFAPPGTYQLAEIGEVAVADRFVLPRGLAYLPGPATRVQLLADGSWRTWPADDQRAAAAHVDRGGPDRPPPSIAAPVIGPWPSTPLVDMPLFVYGTLAPGGAAWEHIAGLVEVVGHATTPGWLYDTGRGWPTATFEVDAPGAGGARDVVQGTLLAPRGPAEADALFRWVDEYEGVPEAYLRTTVPVTCGAVTRWAASYAWNEGGEADARPDLARVPDGKWVVR